MPETSKTAAEGTNAAQDRGDKPPLRVTLVQPPNGYLDHYDLAPPLGLLSLVAVAREEGAEASLVDFNLHGMKEPGLFAGDFYQQAIAVIEDTRPRLVGFTSMVLESHVCLELARRLKDLDSDVITVLGGPHFSAIAREVLELYPWIDYVVTGEGELPFRDLLRMLRGADIDQTLVNVAFRREGSVALRRRLKQLGSMDTVPYPAYDLVPLEDYFRLNPARLLNFDAGRGCIFRCSFCYSPGHWGQGGQVKSVVRIAEEMRLHYDLGARHLFFVQDNLANSAAEVKELCQALIAAKTGMTWNAYSTMQRLVPDLLDPLAEAGCTELFVGVDAISEKAQLEFGKHFFKGWGELKKRLEECLSRGIIPTCAFMIDQPDDNGSEATDNALLTALLVRNLGCGIRLNTLTVYNSTGVNDELGDVPRHYTELKPRLLLDTPPVIHTNTYAQQHPELFPFHSTVLPPAAYERFVTAMHVAYTLFTSYPRTMLRYAIDDQGSLWQIMSQVADVLGDLVAIDVRHRRSREREILQDLWSRLPVSSATADAFALENAELAVSVQPVLEDVNVTAAGRTAPFRILPYGLVRLSVPMAELSRDDRVASPKSPGHYLVYRDGGELGYCLLDDSVVPELRRIRQTLSDHGDLYLSADVLAEVMSAGLFRPAGTAKEV